MGTSILAINKLSSESEFPAYLAASTAPKNVEGDEEYKSSLATNDIPKNVVGSEKYKSKTSSEWLDSQNTEQSIQEIKEYLNQHKGDAEILIVIHGYNTNFLKVVEWYQNIQEHIKRYKNRAQGFLIIGYRWPSEQIIPNEILTPGQAEVSAGKNKISESGQGKKEFILKQLKNYRNALPVLLGLLFLIGTTGLTFSTIGWTISLILAAFDVPFSLIWVVSFTLFSIFCLAAIAPIFTILLLRFVVYFRDSYRANNFGTPDLVELIRQIDYVITKDLEEQDKQYWHDHRIKLSFVGHSMGGFVVTNTVRILSDVFDSDSVGTTDAADSQKDPSAKVGNVFCLERLVLVSPDIPAETIISGRANFLQSSLRRFKEAYLFSNEGDMALRLASTAANYFTYPAKTRDGGYRLGNVTVRSYSQTEAKQKKQEQQEKPENYGLIARLPSDLLVKLKGPLDQPSTAIASQELLGCILGGHLAKVEGEKLLNFQGEIINKYKDREPLSIAESELECLQEFQIFGLATGEFFSLKTQENGDWYLIKLKEGDLCRLQKNKLFALDSNQVIQLSSGRTFTIQGGNTGENISRKTDGVSPLEIQDERLVRYQGGDFIMEKTKDIFPSPAVTEQFAITWQFPLDYLYIRKNTPLAERQKRIALAANEQPIGECFTFFDCTDYQELLPGTKPPRKPVGVVSRALRKQALGFRDYVTLTADYFSGKIDTHSGYFSNGDGKSKPDATLTKLMIYGLAGLGLEVFLQELKATEMFQAHHEFYEQILEDLRSHSPQASTEQHELMALLIAFSGICQEKGIQGVLSQKLYKDIIANRSINPST